MADASFSAPPSAENHQVSDRQLRWGLWATTHRALFRKIGYGALVAVSVVSWAYTLWGFVDYFFVSGARFERELAAFAARTNPRAAIIARQRPQEIEIPDVLLIPTGGQMYDAAARVANPNAQWLFTADVALDIPGTESAIERIVVLPGRERWVARINAKSAIAPSEATFRVLRADWQRISRLEVPDAERFISERSNVAVRDAAFTTTAPAGTSAAPTIGRAAFTAVNASAYGLRHLEFVVLLRRGTVIVGVNRTVIDDLLAGEQRSVAATWFTPVGLVTSVQVVPYVNVFDPDAFLEPVASGSQPL